MSETTEIDRKIHIWAEIEEEAALEWTKQIDRLEIDLLKQAIDVGVELPMIISICSGGGSTHHSLAIADKIKRLRVPTITIVEGYACSGASLISMAGKTRQITPNSFMMIHSVWMSIYGKHNELKDYIDWSDKLMEKAIEYYMDRTKLKRSKVKKLLSKDKFFNAEECLKLGFVDAIL